jgi:multisubunit Na+/H+ antiporter MnhB subunit
MSLWYMAPGSLIFASATVLMYVLYQERRRARKVPAPEVLLSGTVVKTQHEGTGTTTATVSYRYGGDEYEDKVTYDRKATFFYEGAHIPLYLTGGRVYLDKPYTHVDARAIAYLVGGVVFAIALVMHVWLTARAYRP